MRVLVDIAHPAHVHFYRFMLEEFTAQGHQWRVVSRDKDITNDLLDSLGIPYTSISSAGAGVAGLAMELLQRDRRLLRIARKFRPDVILTRSPSGTHIGRLLAIPSVFDTDNGKSAGLHYRAAAPFANVITTPDCFPADLGPKQMRYPSYKAMAFLHPNRFNPDPGIKARLGVESGEQYSILRLVSMAASHDRNESGIPIESVRLALSHLSSHGKVFVSSESSMPADLLSLELPTEPNEFHSVLAHASLYVGDSGSVAGEAAILGVPSLFVSSFAYRIPALEELADRYAMVKSLRPSDQAGLRDALEQWEATPASAYVERRQAILRDKIDLTEWYVRLVNRYVSESA